MENRPSNLALPNRVQYRTMFHPGPLVTPAVVNINQPGAIDILSFGGLTKLEHVAALLLAGSEFTAAQAVEAAKQLLEVCAAAQQPGTGAESEGSDRNR